MAQLMQGEELWAKTGPKMRKQEKESGYVCDFRDKRLFLSRRAEARCQGYGPSLVDAPWAQKFLCVL